MPKQSAGILLYHFHEGELKLFLVHPGGPFWKKKDEGAWTIPKGEFDSSEDAMAAAKREFMEETGIQLKAEHYIPLSQVKMKSGKIIFAWAAEGHLIPEEISSNTVQLQMKSGSELIFPEIDKGEWFTVDDARKKIIPVQAAFIDELILKLEFPA